MVADVYNEEYFRKYYSDGYKRSYDLQIEKVKKQPFVDFVMNTARALSQESQELRILDVGCARGFLVKTLKECGFETYGVDISKFAIETCERHVRKNLFLLDIENQELCFPNNWFDFVLSIGTLEHLHLEKMPHALLEIHRVLQPNGYLIVSVPYFYNRLERRKYLHHFSVLPETYWIELLHKHGLSYNAVLTEKIRDTVRRAMAKRFAEHPGEAKRLNYLRWISNERVKELLIYVVLCLKARIYPGTCILVLNKKSREIIGEHET